MTNKGPDHEDRKGPPDITCALDYGNDFTPGRHSVAEGQGGKQLFRYRGQIRTHTRIWSIPRLRINTENPSKKDAHADTQYRRRKKRHSVAYNCAPLSCVE